MANTIVIPGADFSAHKIETVVFGTVPCTGISLDQQTKSLIELTPFTLTATPVPANTTDSVVWTSSDDTVATVSDGVVTPLKLGTVTITATCGTQSASCAVTIDNVVPDYVAICGYNPYKRSANASAYAATTDKSTTSSETAGGFIVAADQATGSYPIETKDVDTSPYRFVPIKIPAGATQVKVSCDIGNFYTRVLWFNSEAKETTYNIGAKCLGGKSSGWDQNSSTAGPVIYDIPTDLTGLDSVALCVALGGGVSRTKWVDYSDNIVISFTYNDE